MSDLAKVIELFDQINNPRFPELPSLTINDWYPLSLVIKEFDWLLNDPLDNVWIVVDSRYEEGHPKRIQTIYFNKILPDGTFLSDYPKTMNAIKSAVILARSGSSRFNKYTSGESQRKFANVLTSLFFLIKDLGANSFSVVSDDVIDILIENYNKGKSIKEKHYSRVKFLIDLFDESNVRLPVLIKHINGSSDRYLHDVFELCELFGLGLPTINEFKGGYIDYVQEACRLFHAYEEIDGPVVKSRSARELDQVIIANMVNIDARTLARTQCKKTRGLILEAADKAGCYMNKKQKVLLEQCHKGIFSENHLSKDTLTKEFSMIQHFHEMRLRLEEHNLDSLKTTPFRMVSSRKMAKSKGSQGDKTIIIPENCALHYMDRSIRWIVDYADMLLDLYEAEEDVYLEGYITEGQTASGATKDNLTGNQEKYVTKLALVSILKKTLKVNDIRKGDNNYDTEFPGNPFPILGIKKNNYGYGAEQREQNQGIYSEKTKHATAINELPREIADLAIGQGRTLLCLKDAVERLLPTACFSVILAFNGRRDIEGSTLLAGCVDGEYPNLWIETYVAKKDGVDRDRFPTEAIVGRAVKVLERLSKRARALSGTDHLAQFTIIGTDEIIQFDLTKQLNYFADFIQTPLDPNTGNPFHFSPHQFRKLFAIMFYWRYGAKDMDALSYHLRHACFEWTQDYISDSITAAVMTEYEKERMYSLFTPQGQRNENLTGKFVVEFAIMANKINSQVSSDVNVISEVEVKRVVDDNDLTLDFMPYGMCAGRSKCRLQFCKCGILNDKPDFDEADVSLCKSCRNFFTHKDVIDNYKEESIDVDDFIRSSSIFTLLALSNMK